jgi:hypothetical protein
LTPYSIPIRASPVKTLVAVGSVPDSGKSGIWPLPG